MVLLCGSLVTITATSYTLHYLARIFELLEGHEAFLDRPGADEPIKERDATCFVVGTTRASSTKRLLSYHRSIALFVVINIPCGMTKPARRFLENGPILGKAGTNHEHGISTVKSTNTYIAPVNAYSVVVSMSSMVLSKSASSYT